MIAVIELGAVELSMAAALVLLNAGASLAFRLGMAGKLVLAALRGTIQLLLLGFLLHIVFEWERWELVLAMMLAMSLLAGFEAVRRTRHRVPGMQGLAMAVMVTGAMAITFYGTQAVIGVEPWYAPRYLIPILGMVLGNTLNGISLGLDASIAGFKNHRAEVELLLAHGASRTEASRDVVREAVRTGLVPVINMMVAAGAISIPGMMTGQILSGESPAQAAAYQLFILFCIAGGTALGTVGVVLLSVRLLFDERDRLRVERIVVRD